ncbi:S8 family serine peptidase [Actinotalea sp. C106]|uniref:S8 family peptidase n=1 Tax=Actinotalea sp. C106 TaxID=2908644 RepID=UPI0025415B30|nr:S8 family serine peptidase [Actinotalea sp. C106]
MRPSLRRIGIPAVTLALLVVPGSPVAATLAERTAVPATSQTPESVEEGLWYVDAAGLDEAHRVSTGEGVTVAVVDTPINPDVADLIGADLHVHEPAFCRDVNVDGQYDPARSTAAEAEHGTQMASIVVGTGAGADGQPGIAGVAPGATVRHYVARTGLQGGFCATTEGTPSAGPALRQAIDDGAQIISLSTGGAMHTDEIAQIARALREGVIVVSSRPNDPIPTYPRDLEESNGVITVESAAYDGSLAPGATGSPTKDVVAPGVSIRGLVAGPDQSWHEYGTSSGTSNATAYTSAALALVWSAHPEATGNQIIQTLLRHTYQNSGELTRHDDLIGYGSVSVLNMLDADPTSYPDANPLIIGGTDALPSLDEITMNSDAPEASVAPGTVGADSDASGDTDPPAPSAGTAGSFPWWLVAVALALVALLVAVSLLKRRRTLSSPTMSPPPPGGHP